MEKYSGQVIKLVPNDGDGDIIEVPIELAKMSITIKNMLEDFGDNLDTPIPLTNVTKKITVNIFNNWCKYHFENDDLKEEKEEDDTKKKSTDMCDFDKKFYEVEQEVVFETILAANYLDIKPLLDSGCKTVANMIKGKSVEELRQLFNIKNDFTPEEEEKVRKENEWCEEQV